MHAMTEANLRNSFSGESQAHMRYRIYSRRAEKEGFPNVARLFRAIAFAERVHATNHLTRTPMKEGTAVATLPFGVGRTSENLQFGIDGESFEVEEMYPTYRATAEFQGEKSAVQTFTWALEAEKIHAGMYGEAKQAVDAGEDLSLDSVQICSVCGYTREGEVRNCYK